MKLTKKELELVQKTIQDLKAYNSFGDEEIAHVEADNALCKLLEGIGLGEVVKAFELIDKWYA